VTQLGELLAVLGVAALAAAVGVGFGIVVLAPRISRALDRAERDEEPGDGRD